MQSCATVQGLFYLLKMFLFLQFSMESDAWTMEAFMKCNKKTPSDVDFLMCWLLLNHGVIS